MANGEEASSNGATTAETAVKALEDAPKEPKKAIYCYTCGVDCTRVRFHKARSTKPVPGGASNTPSKFDVCPNCYKHGRFSADGASVDYVKLEDSSYSSVPDRDAPWTDTELLKLLEALETFDQDWTAIADYVDTRTKEECVLKFLQLDIEGKYIDGEDKVPGYSALNYGRIPIDNSDNPILSTVSFMAGMSNPEVTAAIAGKSVEQMRKALSKQHENGHREPSTKEKQSAQDKVKPESDAMEVDGAPSPKATEENQLAVLADGQVPAETMVLAASAARAAGLASHEEREMTRLVSAATNTTLEKFELKLKQFSEMEAILQAERQEVERAQQQLFLDRLAFKKRVDEANERLRKMQLGNGTSITGGPDEKLGFVTVTGRAEEDTRPLTTNDANFTVLNA